MADTRILPPYYPIIFIRGYAGTETLLEETVASPYMGFNEGSTKIRQRWTGAITRHIFESPLLRLIKDWGYLDAYREGAELSAVGRVPARTVFIYRYYDQASRQLGTGRRQEIETWAGSWTSRGARPWSSDTRAWPGMGTWVMRAMLQAEAGPSTKRFWKVSTNEKRRPSLASVASSAPNGLKTLKRTLPGSTA